MIGNSSYTLTELKFCDLCKTTITNKEKKIKSYDYN